MPKSRARRRTNASGGISRDGTRQQSSAPARRDAGPQRPLLDRILDTPHLAQVVPRLQPEVLHRIIQNCGLEECGELVALTTADQLARIFDLDLWSTERPGLDEQFDADRFGVWLEVLMESGATVAAQKLSEIDAHLVITALAEHVRVFDRAAVSPELAREGCEIGGYRIVARRTGSWDAIVAVLLLLDVQHPAYFHRVMRGCRSLSNAGREIDGLDDLLNDKDQVLFDLAVDREQRREKQGYVTAAQARAFLQMARQLELGRDATPPVSAIARAYFRSIEWASPTDATANSEAHPLPETPGSPPAPPDGTEAITEFVAVLIEAGVLTPQPRALLDAPEADAPRVARIHSHLQFAHDYDSAAYSMRTEELAYLANTLVAGCSIQGRPFTVREAADATAAVCNLGLENWPPHWLPEKAPHGSSAVDHGTTRLPEDFLVSHDLIGVFEVGWKVLYDNVSMYAAEQLISVLTQFRYDDRDIQGELNALRSEMAKHWQAGTPWQARDALDVIMILDMPAWAALLGLIDQCPVIHAGLAASRESRARAVSASAFEFISDNSQIASVREFMQSLPETLRR
jgi:hypothetical protein